MASQVAICNLALTKLGSYRITSIDQNTEPARVLSSMWDMVRDDELRDHLWNFSIERTSLAALASTPSWGFDLEYQLPSDCLKVIQVGQYYPGGDIVDYVGSSTAPYKIEGRKIRTNDTAPIKLLYVKRITDTGQWDAGFVNVFACRLALESCERITQSTAKMASIEKQYKMALIKAGVADATENPPEELADSSWLMSRL
jgi:hypothetical protein